MRKNYIGKFLDKASFKNNWNKLLGQNVKQFSVTYITNEQF